AGEIEIDRQPLIAEREAELPAPGERKGAGLRPMIEGQHDPVARLRLHRPGSDPALAMGGRRLLAYGARQRTPLPGKREAAAEDRPGIGQQRKAAEAVDI